MCFDTQKILYPEGVGGAIAMRSDSLMMMDSEKRLKVTIKDCTFRNSFALLEVPSEVKSFITKFSD